MKTWFTFICLCLLLGIPAALPAQDDNARAIQEQEERLAKDSGNTDALRQLLFLYLHKADYHKAVIRGERLLDIGYRKQDYNNTVMYAHTGLGQAYTMLGDSVKAYNNLCQARLNAESIKNDSALCSVYNGFGLYAININKDQYSGLHYFFKGLEAAKRSHNEHLRAILLGNIASTYYLKQDTAGLPYSLEAYKVGHRQTSPYLIYIGAMTTAYMQYLRGHYDEALPYIKEAEFIMQQNNYYDQGLVYALHGSILSAQGNTRLAIGYFQKGLALKEQNQASTQTILLHGYAQALRKEGKYAQAISLLQEALKAHDKNKLFYRSEIIDELATCHAGMGDYAQAFQCLRLLKDENDSTYNTDKEKIISDLRIKYDVERQENEIQQSKLILLKKEKHEQLLIGILVIIVLIAVSLWLLYQRKSRLYQTIVRQKQEALRREEQLQDTIRRMNREEGIYPPPRVSEEPEKKYVNSSLSDEKKNNLFQRLELCMMEQAIYHDNFLTLKQVAETLDTNRTYLSQVINEQTGQTFTQYINHYRINEAVRLLGDPNVHLSIKAISAQVGFSSPTTFYKVFQSSVGMSPREYRENALSLPAIKTEKNN